jgi:6,7-dimethyl-8-ribityllumazine synthase
MKGIESVALDGSGLRVAIVSTRWNQSVVGRLLEGARTALMQCGIGASDIEEHQVPGAFELPMGARWVADTGRVDAVVCLGAVIRGETPHFDFVAGEASRGIMQVALETGVPVTFGVITADTDQQAEQRAGGSVGNKGVEAAEAAVEMALLYRRVTANP